MRGKGKWLAVWSVLALAAVATAAFLGWRSPRRRAAQILSTVTQPSTTATQPTTAPVPREPEWNLLLVNPWNSLPEAFTVELETTAGGYQVDSRIVQELEQMLSDAREEGLDPIICSAYRTADQQTTLYNNKIQRLQDAGCSPQEAREQAGTVVAVPGTSEHQTGLALDIVARSYQILEEDQADTAEQQWLMKNAHRYGFILRYPQDKTACTGIAYEPWHYRYVGREAAGEIYTRKECLEEYLQRVYG